MSCETQVVAFSLLRVATDVNLETSRAEKQFTDEDKITYTP
jgi:hypothetical protein